MSEASQGQLARERAVLRGLCNGTLAGAARAQAMQQLSAECFEDPLHREVFAALKEIPRSEPAILREHLPLRLLNRGFVDVELDEFFATPGAGGEQLARWIAELAARAAGRKIR
jgi:hypothetical protein